ncbi:MAG: hypothetical protein ACI8UP_003664 [Porticoccaceae bacterium]|jgi:hypothetical protein
MAPNNLARRIMRSRSPSAAGTAGSGILTEEGLLAVLVAKQFILQRVKAISRHVLGKILQPFFAEVLEPD